VFLLVFRFYRAAISAVNAAFCPAICCIKLNVHVFDVLLLANYK